MKLSHQSAAVYRNSCLGLRVLCTFCVLMVASLAPCARSENQHSSPSARYSAALWSQQLPRSGRNSNAPSSVKGHFAVAETDHSPRAQESGPTLATQPLRRPVTVADSIEMTRVAGPTDVRDRYTGAVFSDFAVFSPDGSRFVVVVRRGNLDQNTMEYSMLLFASNAVFHNPMPRTLVTFASSSYREGIRDVKWLADNETILFLGERPSGTTQLYSVACTSGKIEQLTHELDNIVGYGVSADGTTVVFGKQLPSRDLYDASVLRNGLVVTTEPLQALISGRVDSDCQQLFTIKSGGAEPKPTVTHGRVCQDPLELFVSPDGRYVVVKTNVADVPGEWKQYEDPYLKRVLVIQLPEGSRTLFDRYELIDLDAGASSTLLNSPIGFVGAEVLWAPDSKSVILTDVFLPLNVPEEQRKIRRSSTATAEVSVPNRDVTVICDHDLAFPSWEPSSRYLQLRPSRQPSDRLNIEYFRKQGSRWKKAYPDARSIRYPLPQVVVEQDLNTPPRIAAIDPRSRRKATLLDLNPQFRELAFGKVEDVTWVGGAGRKVHGGLYLPPDYVPGHRYPLVIQTHGFDPHGFWTDGSFTTAFAAQPLAGKGIVVLQVPDDHQFLGTPQEAPRMMETYERAIDYLNGRGVIDRSRVGIIGFSRTCLYVKYMLTHSTYRLAAVTVADGVDSGYFQYLVYATEERGRILTSDTDKLVGDPPFGNGLLLWLKHSPGFLLDKVRTPIRIEAHGGPDGGGVLGEWEWFAGLRRFGKPVELLYLPAAGHVLDRPWERMASQQGDVDWFCFWLKGEQDPAPDKSQQYIRWREFKDLLAAQSERVRLAGQAHPP